MRIGQVLPLADARQAHEILERLRPLPAGKVVVNDWAIHNIAVEGDSMSMATVRLDPHFPDRTDVCFWHKADIALR